MNARHGHTRINEDVLKLCIDLIVPSGQKECENLSNLHNNKKQTTDSASPGLKELAREILEIRLTLGENRKTFAKRIGSDPLDLFAIENMGANPLLVKSVINKIDGALNMRLANRYSGVWIPSTIIQKRPKSS